MGDDGDADLKAADERSAAKVAHDLLNPIAAALGYAHVLADPNRDIPDERRVQFAQEIVSCLQKVRTRLPEALGLPPEQGGAGV